MNDMALWQLLVFYSYLANNSYSYSHSAGLCGFFYLVQPYSAFHSTVLFNCVRVVPSVWLPFEVCRFV